MMKRVMSIALASLSLSALAVEPEKTVYPVPPSQMEDFNKRTGGLVDPPANGKKLLILDCREKDSSTLTNLVKAAEMQLSLACSLKKMTLKDANPTEVAFSGKSGEIAAVVMLLEKENFPTLSVYPEDAIAIVNLRKMQDPEYNVYRKRLVKEFWRGVGFAIGGYGNLMQGGVMLPVYSVTDLDDLVAVSLPATAVNTITVTKNRIGLYRKNPVPYSRAVKEGWAPAPTNEAQRAVWDKLHAIPSKPLIIRK